MRSKALLFSLLLILSSNVFAEYYLVNTPEGPIIPRCGYRGCWNGCYVNIRSRAPRRHGPSLGQEQYAPYDWVGDP